MDPFDKFASNSQRVLGYNENSISTRVLVYGDQRTICRFNSLLFQYMEHQNSKEPEINESPYCLTFEHNGRLYIFINIYYSENYSDPYIDNWIEACDFLIMTFDGYHSLRKAFDFYDSNKITKKKYSLLYINTNYPVMAEDTFKQTIFNLLSPPDESSKMQKEPKIIFGVCHGYKRVHGKNNSLKYDNGCILLTKADSDRDCLEIFYKKWGFSKRCVKIDLNFGENYYDSFEDTSFRINAPEVNPSYFFLVN